MGPYNGFTGQQRARAQAWLRRAWAAGDIPRPSRCDACGQTEGAIQAHAEDYGEPFGVHVQAYHLCLLCHGMLHLRFRYPQAWQGYRGAVAMGCRFRAATGPGSARALCAGKRGHYRMVPRPQVLLLDALARGSAPATELPRLAPVRLVFADGTRFPGHPRP